MSWGAIWVKLKNAESSFFNTVIGENSIFYFPKCLSYFNHIWYVGLLDDIQQIYWNFFYPAPPWEPQF